MKTLIRRNSISKSCRIAISESTIRTTVPKQLIDLELVILSTTRKKLASNYDIKWWFGGRSGIRVEFIKKKKHGRINDY